jgi:hypothetical protein
MPLTANVLEDAVLSEIAHYLMTKALIVRPEAAGMFALGMLPNLTAKLYGVGAGHSDAALASEGSLLAPSVEIVLRGIPIRMPLGDMRA